MRGKIACQLCGLNKTCEEPRHKPISNNKPAGMVCEYNLEQADKILQLIVEELDKMELPQGEYLGYQDVYNGYKIGQKELLEAIKAYIGGVK